MVNPETQLWAPLNVFKGAPNGTSASSQYVWTLRNMAQLASLAGDEASAASYGQQANVTAQAVNQLLFNATTGSYAVSITDGNYSYIDSEWRIPAFEPCSYDCDSSSGHVHHLWC